MPIIQGVGVIILISIVPVALWYWGIILYGTLRSVIIALFILFVIVPLVFKYTYTLQRNMIFLNFVSWPRNIEYSAPYKYGITGTRNFYVETDEGVKLGVWHTLPSSLESAAQNHSAESYEELLSHGEPVILYMHGNSGSRASPHRVELYQLLKSLNYHVVSFDYRSYGDSSPEVPTEKGVVADGKFMYHWLSQKVKSNAPLMVWGHSLGTGVSSHVLHELAKEDVHVKALVLESPFNNLRDEMREHPFAKLFRKLPWFEACFLEPVSANNLRFESDKHLADVLSPVLILHAEDDLVVPYILGRRLFNTALLTRHKEAGPVEFIRFEGFHNYGHKYICRAPELPRIIQDFVANSTRGALVKH